MSTMQTAERGWVWSEDVLEFARERGLTTYLDPVRALCQTAFPDTSEIRVRISADLEYAADVYLLWEIDFPNCTPEEYRARTSVFDKELFRIVPAPKVPLFCFIFAPES